MAIHYDQEDLGKTLDKLNQQLNKAEEQPEDTSADLVKSLADMANKAMDLATTRKAKKKKKEAGSSLAKAQEDGREMEREADKDLDKADDHDEDEKDEKPAWLKEKVEDGKAEGEMMYAGNRTAYGNRMMTNAGGESHQMGKSVQIGNQEVFDVGEYLGKALAVQEATATTIMRLERLHKSLINGLIEIESRIQQLEAQGDEQARFSSMCAKALGHIIDTHETYMDQPVSDSRHAGMEKSIALAQRREDSNGGVLFPMKARTSDPMEMARVAQNKELLSKAALTGKISAAEQTYIKRTERLPAGVSLN